MSVESSFKALLEGRSLSAAEAEAAMEEIMTGQASAAKLAGWLVAMRVKGETPSEIAGCAKAMIRHAVKLPCKSKDSVDTCGTGGDGLHTINISTGAAFVAAGAGVRVAKHGNKAVSSKSGSADVLDALGIDISIHPERAALCLDKVGIAFLFAPSFHPAMKHAAPIRRELGVRTIFNILGPLTNPAGATRAVLGVYSDPLCRKMAEAARELGFTRLMAVHGCDGLDEITIAGSTRVCELRDGEILDYQLTPEEFGVKLSSTGDLSGGTPVENASIIKDILAGRERSPRRDVIEVNAAAAIMVAGKADSWKEAFEAARKSIDSGAAMAKLQELSAFTKAK